MSLTQKPRTNVRKDKCSDQELAAIIALNSDCQRTKLDPDTAPACRSRMVRAASLIITNPFALVHVARRIARQTHGRNSLMSTSINEALAMVAAVQPSRTPVQAIAQAVAA